MEVYHKRLRADNAEDVDIYRGQYGLLRRSAVQGGEARELVRRAIGMFG